MKKISLIFYVLIILLLNGCAKSLIKIVLNDDKNSHLMFGKNSKREFFIPVNISDSLKFIWEQDAYGGFTNSSVVYKDSIIFVSDLAGRIHCFNIENGKQVGVLKSKGAVFSTPLISNYKLIYALVDDNDDETELIFYDMHNGKELFITYLDGRVNTQMLFDREDIILCTENGIVHKISSGGKKVWDTKLPTKNYCNLALVDNIILAGTINGDIIAINSETGLQMYNKKMGEPFFSGITIDLRNAFIADNSGILYCFEVKTGKLIWKYNTESRVLMNPAVDDKNLYIGNLNGDLFSINKSSGKLNWKTRLNGVLNSTPLITENRIVITNLFKSFSIINKDNGFVKKTYFLDGRGKLSPVLVENKLFIGHDDGVIRAYEFIY